MQKMQSVTLTPITWAKVRAGMEVFFQGRKVKVEGIGTNNAGHRLVTMDGMTHTMRAGEKTTLITPR